MAPSRSSWIKIEAYIASQTPLSRRKIFDLLSSGKITCDGETVTRLDHPIIPGKNLVKVNGKPLRGPVKFVVYKLNKPAGIISTLSDPKNRKCLTDLMQKLPNSLFPVGRLDRQTKGLLLLTNDGALAHRLMHPKYEISKRYRVQLKTPATKRQLQQLESGFFLDDGPIQFTDVTWVEPTTIELSLHSGRNRVVRRSFETLGHPKIGLKRLQIGPIHLGKLKEGQAKPLTPGERRALDRVLESG